MYETLKALTVEELRTKCKDLGLRNYSGLNEDELLKKIIDSGKLESTVLDDDSDDVKLESTVFERTFKRLIPNPLTIGAINVPADVKIFVIDENHLDERTIQRLNNSIGKIIEEI
tara:strand:- start:36 stop:380 length:345 start_codon:yes stop_codon:yes gene_type:complete